MTTKTVHTSHAPWPMRAALFALLGALTGHLIWTLTNFSKANSEVRMSLAVFVAVAALAFGYTLERGRLLSSVFFALISGIIMGFVVYWNGSFGAGNGEVWRIACGIVTIMLAAPLFMAWRVGPGGRTIPYVTAHDRAWTSAMLWFASFAFMGLTWALAWLLAMLFDLIGIDALRRLLGKEWFTAILLGAALGGGVGLLRDREAVLGTLQRVVMTVLAVLAPAFAAGLLLFLIALPFTGLAQLWSATKATTPILLACVTGALLLANAVIGDTPEDEAKHPLLRYGAMGLAVAILPLAIIAAVSTGLRIQQYGMTPDRLWAVVFTAIATAYGLVYIVSLARGRMTWSSILRPGNMRMAISVCIIAFVLAMPFISFGALSTRDQLARLDDGRTPLAKFDWMALRYDFGPSGKAAIESLAKSGKSLEIRAAAKEALKINNRYDARVVDVLSLDKRLTILPVPTPLPPELRDKITQWGPCAGNDRCVMFFKAGDNNAVVTNGKWATSYRLIDSQWLERANNVPTKPTPEEIKSGRYELRIVTRRQVFVAGKPVGETFE